MEYPIIFKGAYQFNYCNSRCGEKATAIVIHIAQTPTLEALSSWFHNPAAEVSSHFGVGDDAIYQFVRVESASYANGPIAEPNLAIPWVADCLRDNAAFISQYNFGIPNARSITIENTGNTGDKVSEGHWSRLVWLVAKLCAENNISADRNHIIKHADLDSVTRHDCPGSGYDLDKLVKDVQAMLKDSTPITSFIVGDGVLAAMKNRGDSPATNEQYFEPAPGQKFGLFERSFTWGVSGSIYLAFKMADNSWDVQVVEHA